MSPTGMPGQGRKVAMSAAMSAETPSAVQPDVPQGIPQGIPQAAPDTAPPVRRSDFDFELPPEQIAQHPTARRTDARLLRLRGSGASFALDDLHVSDLATAFAPGDLLICNDTRVIKARLSGERESGGKVEALIERPVGTYGGLTGTRRALALLRASHPPKPGQRLHFGTGGTAGTARFEAVVRGREDDLFELEFSAPIDQVLEAAGQIPLPPYIRHRPDEQDAERYQTVYAQAPGAVAAPTAGLHFDAALLARLQEHGVQTAFVTLHVGAGTFQPVRAENLTEHRMHKERYVVPQATADAVAATRSRGGRIVAVGTTSVRALESSVSTVGPQAGHVVAGAGETELFILPGFRFRVVDRLLTNFHLPGSTLLMLVSAFGGLSQVRQAYEHAVRSGYRFFSYGDAMLLDREELP